MRDKIKALYKALVLNYYQDRASNASAPKLHEELVDILRAPFISSPTHVVLLQKKTFLSGLEEQRKLLNSSPGLLEEAGLLIEAKDLEDHEGLIRELEAAEPHYEELMSDELEQQIALQTEIRMAVFEMQNLSQDWKSDQAKLAQLHHQSQPNLLEIAELKSKTHQSEMKMRSLATKARLQMEILLKARADFPEVFKAAVEQRVNFLKGSFLKDALKSSTQPTNSLFNPPASEAKVEGIYDELILWQKFKLDYYPDMNPDERKANALLYIDAVAERHRNPSSNKARAKVLGLLYECRDLLYSYTGVRAAKTDEKLKKAIVKNALLTFNSLYESPKILDENLKKILNDGKETLTHVQFGMEGKKLIDQYLPLFEKNYKKLTERKMELIAYSKIDKQVYKSTRKHTVIGNGNPQEPTPQGEAASSPKKRGF